ncbi:MAG: OmpW family outer membrane protein [Halioglobus sp.]
MKKAASLALAVSLASGSMFAQAYQAGDLILRLGATTVSPNDDSDNITLPTDPATVLRGVEVDDDTQLGIIPAMMVTDHLGFELLLATPFEHDVTVKGAPLDAGSIKHLPPTLSLQWYPRGNSSGWQPYIGVGLNYTFIYDEDASSDLKNALGELLGAEKVDLSLQDSFGLSGQVGVDIPLNENWALNAGVWYIDIDTEARIKTDIGSVKFDVDIDPWVYNFGIAYKF